MTTLPEWAAQAIVSNANASFRSVAEHLMSSMSGNPFADHYPRINEAISIIQQDLTAPHVRMRPKLFIDGNQWCALYGENIQDGVAGFGDSPDGACASFDMNWWKSLKPAEKGVGRESTH